MKPDPQQGCYFSTRWANQPVIQVRHSDGEGNVLNNRCRHKARKLVIDRTEIPANSSAALFTPGLQDRLVAVGDSVKEGATKNPGFENSGQQQGIRVW